MRNPFITHMVIYMILLLTVQLTLRTDFYSQAVIWALFCYIIGREILDAIRWTRRVKQLQHYVGKTTLLAIILAIVVAWVTLPERYLGHLLIAGVVANLFASLFLHNKTVRIMATEEQFLALLGRIDTATNGIATELRDLKDQLANQGLPKDVEDAVLAKLEGAATKLEAVGKSDESQPGESQPGESQPG